MIEEGGRRWKRRDGINKRKIIFILYRFGDYIFMFFENRFLYSFFFWVNVINGIFMLLI